ncbi:MAG TPA: pilus assembly PilX N-terminal domain-containing protein [Patescibacteria group bacterium]|nr:pilus assembly PilX N-terminal domain-containing protein [Patescibacteria group bacterium]
MKKQTKNSLRPDQKGIASIVIVILIMTFLSLIVLAMTRNANREQRQALDRQLNSQAFYAAESGINDAQEYLVENPDDAPVRKTNCGNITGTDNGNQFGEQTSRVGSTENDSIRYSCVLYDTEPITIDTESKTTEPDIYPIKDTTGGLIQDLIFTWSQPTGSSLNFDDCPPATTPTALPPILATTCNAGALRVELIDMNPSISSREDLIRRNFIAYLMPSSPGMGLPTKQFNAATNELDKHQGQVWSGSCTNEGKCSLKINNVGRNALLLNLRSIYKNNFVSISGHITTPTGLQEMHFKDAQMMVDSTGRANDILKRIQVRVDISEFSGRKNNPSGFAFQTSEDICKLIDLLPPAIGATNNHCD